MSIQKSIDDVTQLASEFVNHQTSIKHYRELIDVLGKFEEAGLPDLRNNKAMQSLLEEKGTSIQFPTVERDRLSGLAEELLEAFNAEPTAQSLKAERRLQNALIALKKLVSAYQLEVENAYKEFIRSKYGGIDLRDLSLSAAKTPQNSQLIRKFKAEYEHFIQVQKIKPFTGEVLDNIETIGATLQTIINKIDFDVPDEVMNFFNGIESGGANLNLLNKTVFNYLDENDMISDFRIIKTGMVVDN